MRIEGGVWGGGAGYRGLHSRPHKQCPVPPAGAGCGAPLHRTQNRREPQQRATAARLRPGAHNDNSFLAALVKEKMQGIFALSPAERDAAETNSKVLLEKPLIAKRTQRTSFDLV